MFRINLKFAIRNLLRFKTYSILNILGLSIGLALGIFVILYINYGYKYDHMHNHHERMYKLLSFTLQGEGKSIANRRVSVLIGDGLKQQAPEIESYNRIVYTSGFFKKESSSLGEPGIFADPNFFSLFNFPLVEGNPSQVLNSPDQMVITEGLSKKLFGDKPAVGQSVSVLINDKAHAFRISGVCREDKHSSMRFGFVIPFSTFLTDFPFVNSFTVIICEYVFLIRPNVSINEVNNKIKHFLDGKDDTSVQELFLQPLSEVDLYYYQDGTRHMNKSLTIMILSIIGGLILLISTFNFINMAIAIGIKRNREAGIKKILGSSKFQVALQFITESLIICLIALFFAFILLETILPLYNQIDNVELKVDYSNPVQMMLFIGFAVLVGLMASLYPALLLGSTSPIKILKGISGNRQRIGFSRQGLVVFQFIVTIILLVGLFVFSNQARFIESKNIGIDRNDIMYFSVTPGIMQHRSVFHSELFSIPEVTTVSWNNQIPLHLYFSTTNVLWEGKQADQNMDFWTLATDSAFYNTFRPQLAEGRFFSSVLTTDSANYIVNEEAVRKMQLKDPIGKSITVNDRRGTIVGIVKNFNTLQLMAPYVPVIIRYRPEEASMVFIRFKGNRNQLQQELQAIYGKYEDYVPFEPKLVETTYEDLNRMAENGYHILSMISVLAIFLAIMGLYGLASFTIETRTKEIGIRKSNGASTLAILRMFLRTYSKWIIVASCIALPIAFIAWNMLLKTFFVFRATYPMWSLIAAPLLVIFIAWITVIWHSWKAASKNPVEALRYE